MAAAAAEAVAAADFGDAAFDGGADGEDDAAVVLDVAGERGDEVGAGLGGLGGELADEAGAGGGCRR